MRRIFILLAFTIVTASFLPGDDKQSAPAVVYERDDNTWFEGDWSHVTVSQDADWAAYATRSDVHLVSLAERQRGSQPSRRWSRLRPMTSLSAVPANRRAAESVARKKAGSCRMETALSRHRSPAMPRSPAPPTANRSPTSANRSAATASSSELRASSKNFRYKGEVAGVAFNSDNTGVYVVFVAEDGASSLVLDHARGRAREVIAGDLDMNNGNNSIGVSPGRPSHLSGTRQSRRAGQQGAPRTQLPRAGSQSTS